MTPPSQPHQTATMPGPTGRPAGADAAHFLADVRADVPRWVGVLVVQAVAALESAEQRHAIAGDRSHTLPALKLLQSRSRALADAMVRAVQRSLDTPAVVSGDSPAPGTGTGNAPGRLALTLMDEAQIDEDIEIGRLVQSIDAGSELERLQLAALCSGLQGLDFVDPQCLPLQPLVCARALREGVAGLAADADTRALLLRHLGEVAGREMRTVYAAQLDGLERRGVQAAPFRLNLTAEPGRPGPAAGPRDDEAAHAPSTAPSPPRPSPALHRGVQPVSGAASPLHSLQRLVEHARADIQHSGDAADALTLRLPGDPLPTARDEPPLDHAIATQLMDQLFRHMEEQTVPLGPGRSLLARLRRPGQVLAEGDPRLWQNLDHPWWRLLDQIIALDATAPGHTTTPAKPDPVHAALAEAVARLAQSPSANRRNWQVAWEPVKAALERAVAERRQALEPQAGNLQHQAEAQEMEIAMRNQVVQQLRSTPVSAGLRPFLLGPWTQVLTHAALQHGTQGTPTSRLALVLDDLIHATQQPGQRVSSAQRTVLLRQVREGLATLGLPPERLETEITDLRALLRNPPPVEQETWEEAVDTLPTPWVLDLHAALPTVPLEMPDATPARTGADDLARHAAWFSTLEPGAHCRLFLMGRWMTVQLDWVGETRKLFLFTNRHGGRTHSLTRRMLEKLREAGLAATIEDGFLVAQAMDSLVDTRLSAH